MATQTSALLISALGGALGALILRSILKLVGAVWTRRKLLAIHQCATRGSRPGEFDHCWGKVAPDPDSTTGEVWEHNWEPVRATPPHIPMGDHTVYGPYVNDFGRPGFYRVTFSLRGVRSRKPEGSVVKDNSVITLDVVQAPFGTVHDLRLLGQRIVKVRELLGSYQDFDIVCFASGTDVYEYRCAVSRDANPEETRILFDCVRVYPHPSIWEAI
jgi:hypothetical protein